MCVTVYLHHKGYRRGWCSHYSSGLCFWLYSSYVYLLSTGGLSSAWRPQSKLRPPPPGLGTAQTYSKRELQLPRASGAKLARKVKQFSQGCTAIAGADRKIILASWLAFWQPLSQAIPPPWFSIFYIHSYLVLLYQPYSVLQLQGTRFRALDKLLTFSVLHLGHLEKENTTTNPAEVWEGFLGLWMRGSVEVIKQSFCRSQIKNWSLKQRCCNVHMLPSSHLCFTIIQALTIHFDLFMRWE